MVPGEDEGEVIAEISGLLERAAIEAGVLAEIIEYKPTTGGATETAASHPIAVASLAASKRHGGEGHRAAGFPGRL
jgi:acetylornithine deacetylase/succinyl-diaminopimelate desuccinylase